ncbi:MAG: ImmA/IrrE family metallo-endopeptidase [Candidatus Binataceae bacterium]
MLNRPIRLGPGDVVEAFASLREFREIGDLQRFRIIEIANAAKELHPLEDLLGRSPGKEIKPIAHNKGVPAHRQGAEAATRLRQELGLARGPIGSVRNLVRERFPHIRVLYSELGAEGPAGITFANSRKETFIALNLQGKNLNPTVRRFSLAHELGHVLMDRSRGKPLAILSGYQTETGLLIERRANAFAIRLLCPENELASLPDDGVEAAKTLIQDYGMHYSAARLYLKNEAKYALPEQRPESIVGSWIDEKWEAAEKPYGIFDFPLTRVPAERRTYVAEMGAQAYSRGKISRTRFADLLRVPPTEEVEQVLDFFELAPPEEMEDVA